MLKWLRYSLLLLPLLLSSAKAQTQVLTQWGQDNSGTTRNVYVLNPIDLHWISIGTFNTSNDTWAIAPIALPTPTASTLGAVFSFAGSAHNFLISLGTNGQFGFAQPDFTDLSGTIGAGQISAGTITSAMLASGAALANIGPGGITATYLAGGVATSNIGNCNANNIFAGPTTGSPALLSCRNLVANDIPAVLNGGLTIGAGIAATDVFTNSSAGAESAYAPEINGFISAKFGANAANSLFAYDWQNSAYAVACATTGVCAFGESTKTSTYNGFQQPDTSATLRTVNAHNQDFISIVDFLPTNAISGTTDYSTYFQAAATAGCAANRNNQGMEIYVPQPPFGTSSTYYVHDITQTCANKWRGAGRGVTQINYGSCSSYFMQWQISGFPYFLVNSNVEGGGISDMSLISNGTETCTALIIEGFDDWVAERLYIEGPTGNNNGNGPYNSFFFKGTEWTTISEVTIYNGRNNDVMQAGDLTGCSTTNGTCNGSVGAWNCTTSSATCSTRNDGLQIRNSNFIDNTNTSIGVYIHGFVSDLNIVHLAVEGPKYGIAVDCPAGLNANMSQCPQHIFAWDFESEFAHVNPAFLNDFIQARFEHSYFYGDGSSSNTYDIVVGSTNYTGSTVPCCRLTVDSSIVFAAWNDNIAFGGGPLWDIQFVNNEINGGNISNAGASGINFNGVTVNHFKINNNTIGNVDNFAGTHALSPAVNLSSGSKWGTITDNIFDGVSTSAAPINLNGNANLGTIHIDGNIGPGQSPSISSGCGSGASISGGSGDRSFKLTTGTGAGASCVINFATAWPNAPECVSEAAPGATNVGNMSTSATQVTLASPTSSASYVVKCGMN